MSLDLLAVALQDVVSVHYRRRTLLTLLVCGPVGLLLWNR